MPATLCLRLHACNRRYRPIRMFSVRPSQASPVRKQKRTFAAYEKLVFGISTKQFLALINKQKVKSGGLRHLVETCSIVVVSHATKEIEGMSKGRDRTISKRPDGTWENKRNDAGRASSVHRTQKEAELAAKDMLKNQGGGELSTKGRDGKIRSKDTIAPGNDPNPPKDKEH